MTGNGTKWSTSGILVAGDGTQGSGSTQLNSSRCVYVDANFTVYVCDTSNNRIQMWTQGASSGVTVAGGTSGIGANQLKRPLGLTFDNNGNMYVADTGNNRVQKFAPGSTSGVTVAGNSFGNNGVSASFLDTPTNLLVDNSGYLYVTDNANNRVMKFPPNSTSGTSGTNVFGGSLGNTVYGIAFQNATQNNVFVSLDGAPAVQLRTLGQSVVNSTVANSASVNKPQTLAVDGYGNVDVGDGGSNRVYMFCAGSWIRRTLIQASNATPSTTRLTGIALDSNMNLYVTSTNSSGVYKFLYG